MKSAQSVVAVLFAVGVLGLDLASAGATESAAAAVPPTFAKDVAPILFDNCVSCHRPNEVAPFTLTSYDDAKKRARTIAKVTERRFMPPWKPAEGHGEFVGVRRLTDAQIDTLKAWADAGAPEGDPAQTPALPKFADGWLLGEPDMVVSMPESFTIPAEGNDVYRCFVLPLNVDEDKYVEAVEFRPGNRKIVHHALFFLDTTGRGRELDAEEDGPGYTRMGGPGFPPTGSLGGWAPGYVPNRLPEGVARRIKAGSDLVLQLHMHPSGKQESERSSIGIHFAKKEPKKLFASIPRAIRRFDIPPGDNNHVLRSENELPIPGDLIGITPHAHLLCKEIKVDATLPDGTPQPLIWIKDWDFNWQGEYQYAKPVHLPAGTKVAMEFRYDNSSDNPAQPSNPPRRVTWGEQTTDEMAIIFYHVLIDPSIDDMLRTAIIQRAKQDGIAGGRPRAEGAGAGANSNDAPRRGNNNGGDEGWLMRRLIQRFDKNDNGKLDPDERREAMKAFGNREETTK
jgi:hypothetical protein